MTAVSRGGQTLVTGKIGRVRCLRQQILMPGEKMNISMKGSVRLEALRERDAMRINAHLATFMIPIRWLWSNLPDCVKDGPTGTHAAPPMVSFPNMHALGLGATGVTGSSLIPQFFQDSYLSIVNKWYKWPEAADFTSADIGLSGVKACPLSKTWSRMRFDSTPDQATDYTQTAAADFDVRDLAETQAKFRGAMKRDVLSFNRWMELINETWKGDGSREVDQVPIMLDQVEVGVNPREMPASDGASLGQWQSLFDFNIDHQINGIIAPEHSVILTLLTVRFSPTIESRHALANDNLNWYEFVGDPEYLTAAKPVEVTADKIFLTASTTSLGYLPAGWQWRADHDVISESIDVRDSFPYSLVPTTQAECKDATRIKEAFRSQSLQDYMVDVFFRETGYQPIGDSMDSYFSGMTDDVAVGVGARGVEFPKGGKNL